MINLILNRIYKGDSYTIGKLYIDNEYFCDTLEDTVRQLPEKCKYEKAKQQCKCESDLIKRLEGADEIYITIR